MKAVRISVARNGYMAYEDTMRPELVCDLPYVFPDKSSLFGWMTANLDAPTEEKKATNQSIAELDREFNNVRRTK